MKAVILAAGIGSRLGHLVKDVPKCLLEVGGKAIIDYQIEAIRKSGISEIVVIAGYLQEKVRDHLDSGCTIILNEKFKKTNSMYSLWLARHILFGCDFILFNGDIILEPDLVKKLVNSDKGTAALIDRNRKLRDGEMNVIVEGDVIINFSKQVKANIASGESVQVTKFSGKDSIILFERINRIISEGNLNEFPAAAYRRLIETSKLYAVYTDGLKWFEIDTVSDYPMQTRS